MGENGEDVATSVDIPMAHVYAARCETTAYDMDRFVALPIVPQRQFTVVS